MIRRNNERAKLVAAYTKAKDALTRTHSLLAELEIHMAKMETLMQDFEVDNSAVVSGGLCAINSNATNKNLDRFIALKRQNKEE